MSTRTMGKGKMLIERVAARDKKDKSFLGQLNRLGQIRAELQRVARQIRKSIKLWRAYKDKDSRKEEKDCWDSRIAGAQDVLALLKEAGR